MDEANVRARLEAEERALTIHEAGHAVVAHALGAGLVFVEVYITRPNPDDGMMGGGKTCCREPFVDDLKSLAICVAGYKAELAFAAEEHELANMFGGEEERLAGDSRQMQELLLRFPEADRPATLVEGFRLADVNLQANERAVRDIADALFERRFYEARIEGEELAALLAEVRTS